MSKHERFNRSVWAFPHDFTGALAKWLIHQSPYPVPNNLSTCLEKFHSAIMGEFSFDSSGMTEVSLFDLTERMNTLLEGIPEVMALNERKNGREGMGFSSRYDGPKDPDDDFIDIMALAQNITCEFATEADSRAWLDSNSSGITDEAGKVIEAGLKALCLTRDYVGEDALPAIAGWEWYDAGLLMSKAVPLGQWAEQFKIRVNAE